LVGERDGAFTGVDYDGEKIAVAQAVHLRDTDISFEAADLRDYPLAPAKSHSYHRRTALSAARRAGSFAE
jgi:hypothetical protein